MQFVITRPIPFSEIGAINSFKDELDEELRMDILATSHTNLKDLLKSSELEMLEMSKCCRAGKNQVGEITWPCHVTGVPTPPFSSNQALNSYAIFQGVGKSHF